MTNKVKLSILGISFSQVQAGAYALIFAEENGIRRLPIVIGTPEAQSIAIVMENMTPPRPLTHDLMYNIFKSLRIELLEVFIYKFEDGAFFAELLLRQNNQEFRIDSRTSDAVAIALRTNSPIFTTESIMQNMAIVFDEKEVLANDFSNKDVSDIQEISKNIEEVRIDALQKRLEEAIKDEDYELATKLRDEINRRKSKEND
ncbi:MAG: bifunctional nuclease domain-containing protein [Petrimonas sp.]|nr:MAG: UvrB/uvrC motif protein [Bacteroidetes bacterium ADurb.BinA174]